MSYYTHNSRPVLEAEREAVERIAKMIETELPRVRAMAQNWRNGSGLASALAAAAGLVAAPDVIQAAAPWQVNDGGWILGFGMIAALLAVAASFRASFGWPRRVTLNDLDSLRAWESRELSTVTFCLKASMILTFVATALVLLSGAILVFGFWLPIRF